MRAISKKSRITLLEHAVVQQVTCNKILKAFDVDGAQTSDNEVQIAEYISSLFGIDCVNMPEKEFDKYWDVFYDTVEREDIDSLKKAELIYEAIIGFIGDPPVLEVAQVVEYNFNGVLRKAS